MAFWHRGRYTRLSCEEPFLCLIVGTRGPLDRSPSLCQSIQATFKIEGLLHEKGGPTLFLSVEVLASFPGKLPLLIAFSNSTDGDVGSLSLAASAL